jgi:spore germination cell wall hydrolase CwlJ-like protein
LLDLFRARAEARALLSVIPYGIAAGAVVGVAVGGAYLAGGMARDAVIHAQTNKIAHAAKDGISDDSLRAMTSADPGALSIALRYDPNLLAAPRDHQAAELTQRLALKDGEPSNLFLRASITVPFNPAAQPYHASALDQARQLDCLTQAVYYEARGEIPAGQAAVAQVVLNRVRHPAFPKSVCAVVYQGAEFGHGCQFSFACDGSTEEAREPSAWLRAQRVASRALSGYVMAQVGNATHFHVTGITASWDGMLKVAEVGAHVFYRFGGVHGLPDAFTAKPREELATAGKGSSPIIAAMALEPVAATQAISSPAVLRPAPAPVAANPAGPAAKLEPVAQIKTVPAA